MISQTDIDAMTETPERQEAEPDRLGAAIAELRRVTQASDDEGFGDRWSGHDFCHEQPAHDPDPIDDAIAEILNAVLSGRLDRPSHEDASNGDTAVARYVISRLSEDAKQVLARKKVGTAMSLERGVLPYHEFETFGLAAEVEPHLWKLTPLSKSVRAALAQMESNDG